MSLFQEVACRGVVGNETGLKPKALEGQKDMSNPIFLYHYTTQAACIGIMASSQIWATNIHHLNDSSELKIAVKLTKDALTSRLESFGADSKNKIKLLIDSFEDRAYSNIYVASFSESHDSLSQWRAYGGGVGGYAIGFDSEILNHDMEALGFCLKKCIYNPNKQIEEMSQLVDTLLTTLLEGDYIWIKDKVKDRHQNAIYIFQNAIMSLAPVFKHPTFQEEKEWRIITTPQMVNVIEFRPGKTTFTPYVPISVSRDPQCIRGLTIGPNEDPELAMRTAMRLVGRYLKYCSLSESIIPFRG